MKVALNPAELRPIVDALDDTHQFQLQSGEERWKGIGRFATLGNPAFDEMTWRFVLCFL